MLFERWRTYRRIARAAELAADTPEGVVARVSGVVRVVGGALRGPYTGRTCVGWRVRMVLGGQATTRGGFESSELVPFAIERADGSRVVISARDARFELPGVTELGDWYSWVRYCDERGIDHAHGAEEVAVEPGMRLSVAGIAMIDDEPHPPDGEVGYRDDARRALQLTGDYDHPVLIGRLRSA